MVIKKMVVAGLLLPKPTKKERKQKKEKKRRLRMEELQQIREAVYKRSHRHCENPMCQAELTQATGGEFDHWLGGNGRRQQEESVETVWLLCRNCHIERTANLPSSAAWNLRFELHCERYGYSWTPHFVKPSLAT